MNHRDFKIWPFKITIEINMSDEYGFSAERIFKTKEDLKDSAPEMIDNFLKYLEIRIRGEK